MRHRQYIGESLPDMHTALQGGFTGMRRNRAALFLAVPVFWHVRGTCPTGYAIALLFRSFSVQLCHNSIGRVRRNSH
jgi:hypothetical protein